MNGWNINWIESKATFGDRVEVNKNMKKQLEPYLELFGQGVVIYWFGFVDVKSQHQRASTYRILRSPA